MKTKREERLQRERLRGYQARRTVHAEGVIRRRRDNIIWTVIGVLVVTLATVGQVFFLNSSVPDASQDNKTFTLPTAETAENRMWTGTLTINDIPLGVSLDGTAAPQAVASTVSLTNGGFYNNTSCHRLTTEGIFVLQCGDPKGDGTGGPGYTYGPVENAPTDDVYAAGTIAMARTSGDGSSMGSQFFIVYDESTIPSDAAGGYTVLGTITSGLDELKERVISQGTANGSTDGKPASDAVITSFELK
nr:peptidylprolyl isomerase [Klugiella xanthotipulae]